MLFTVAGMVPLQPFFRGTRTPPSPRIVSCQKCLRTVDIEEVGDATHHTFFEMLGNFSFGDYFKEGAITLAWEFLTDELGVEADRLWPTVHPRDTAAEEIWATRIGVPRERIGHLEDNFWGPAGPSGPCGYDSEIHWDWGPPCSCGRADCRPDDDCGGDRWTELWNLVFPEFDQSESGQRTPLPSPGIDTGMGLERLAAVLQGVRSNYETDLFAPIISGFRSRAEDGPTTPRRTAAFNVLADHLRSAAMLVGDGVTPANEGRGYVLRRLARRAAVHGRRVGLRGGLAAGVDDLAGVMAGAYPELDEHRRVAVDILRTEEDAFSRTLAEGTERLEALIGGGVTELSGADAFRLHDTYGFPIELTVELARERGVDVDLEGFADAMAEQRARSRVGVERAAHAELPALPATTFVGYELLEVDAEVVWVGDSGSPVVVEPSPFYAEAGGQVGDRGELIHGGESVAVVDTQFLPGTDVRALTVSATPGWLVPGTEVVARVDADRRARTARHHSATHLLHRALKDVLGEGVVQRGSLVEADHATFDFNFTRGLTGEELLDIEQRVNRAVRDDLERTATVMPIAQARESGAVAIFEEKYGERVRVVDFGGWSRELCGGTHVQHTGEIGAVILASESSIGSGIRRIDMLAGEAAERRWETGLGALREVAGALRARPEEVPERVAALQAQVRRLQRDVEEARRNALSGGARRGASREQIGTVSVAHLLLDGGSDAAAVRAAVDGIFAEQLQGRGIAVVLGERNLAVKVGGEALQRGLRAGDLVRIGAEVTGGRGGGGSEFASGGVADPSRRDDALRAIREAITGHLGGG